jgi:hypothetical protein
MTQKHEEPGSNLHPHLEEKLLSKSSLQKEEQANTSSNQC